eukprot:CAMPEP_0182855606 /NCGR_PEP_ID=MMETSP0034_2-20130328/1949_1 /TAXON_ID=156128 /ORGANISM="Nephroselmis pyriformis, Strain CCMP717" /LENGTH=51 /DNA_ID=CAMNT_0024986597 /DNA_START=430 /DNA_END=582 /DNA_ORIENTATION=-
MSSAPTLLSLALSPGCRNAEVAAEPALGSSSPPAALLRALGARPGPRSALE